MLGPSAPIPFDPGVLRRGRDLRAVGIEPSRDGQWVAVRRGVWVPAAVWRALTPEQQHAALVHATAVCLDREQPVFALTSAAAVWGLSRVEPWPDSVRVLVERDDRGRGTPLAQPHVGEPCDPVDRGGVLVTPLARTVVDLARTGSLASAVAAADHALRHELCTRTELESEAAAVLPRVRGRQLARLVVDLADPHSMSVGESLSRVQMYLLNLPRPQLQVAYDDADGPIGLVDFDWGYAVGEFDGRVKYRMQDRGQRPPEEVIWAEKQREDRLRRRTRVARWTWDVALDRRRLATVLGEKGVRPRPANTWFDLGGRPSR
ncbi:MAG: hypothetical protein ACRCY8_08735 [Dermatophilaceae bacterium]